MSDQTQPATCPFMTDEEFRRLEAMDSDAFAQLPAGTRRQFREAGEWRLQQHKPLTGIRVGGMSVEDAAGKHAASSQPVEELPDGMFDGRI